MEPKTHHDDKIFFGFNTYNPVLKNAFPDLAREVSALINKTKDLTTKYVNDQATLYEVEQLIRQSYNLMKRVHIEAGLTDGNDEYFNAEILADVIYNIKSYTGIAVYDSNEKEGEEFFGVSRMSSYGTAGGGSYSNWYYFNEKYYSKEQEMFEFLVDYSKAFAKKENINDPIKYMQENVRKKAFFYPSSGVDSCYIYNQVPGMESPSYAERQPLPKGLIISHDMEWRMNKTWTVNISGTTITKNDLWSAKDLEGLKNTFLRYGVTDTYIEYALRLISAFNLDVLMMLNGEKGEKTRQYSKLAEAYEPNIQYESAILNQRITQVVI
jgi:hypothetical protein